MAKIDVVNLALQAGVVATRADKVRRDPAVVKAAEESWSDIRRAGRSTRILAEEALASWRRNGPADGPARALA